MDKDEKLAEQLQMYSELGKQNKNIDISMLALNAIKNEDRSNVSAKVKKWAYLISIGVPPLGLFFALKYYFSNEDDARSVANICVLLTLISLICVWGFGKLLFSSSGTSMDQIQQIKPSDIQQILQ